MLYVIVYYHFRLKNYLFQNEFMSNNPSKNIDGKSTPNDPSTRGFLMKNY